MPAFRIKRQDGEDGVKLHLIESEGDLPPWGPNETLSVVGRPYPRLEGRE
jgi:hypothetical protein